MSGTRHSDTNVEYVLDTATWIGPARGTTPADAREIADLIVAAGLKAEAFDDLRPAQWSKLIFNATVNTVAALTGLPHDAHFAALDDPDDLGHLVRADGRRQGCRGRAGIELGEDPWEMNVLATKRGSAHYPSMLEDVEAHRRTEIDLITGALVREARRRRARTVARDDGAADQGEGGELDEGVCRRLRRGRVAVRGESRDARRRRGLGLRPGPARTSTRSTATACA